MRRITTAALASLFILPAIAGAQSAEDILEARQGFMKMLSLNMAPLAAMAKGEMPYDEAAASLAAANIEALSGYAAAGLFTPGTANGEVEDSDALPAIWEKPEQFAQEYAALGEAAAGASEAVKGGQGNIGPVLQKLGGACKDCHDDFRKPQ
ncbi:c-type cytochrome [Paracoccus spongiarum]|uniref:Cytochrome c n=1 Tax=Paracoccus spongiarum TaxID=3064387 RepID=A0ABT9JAG0_9RHOB|nr:cytochrome c [Paracoccus sp. 2205BS29-5]MDP5306808.1 cytochrome c [Paracoccus sp. 2205BS29-5]